MITLMEAAKKYLKNRQTSSATTSITAISDEQLYGRLGQVVEQVVMFESYIEPERLVSLLAAGHAVIPWAVGQNLQRPVAVGDGFSCKVNANIGTSPDCYDLDMELAKLDIAIKSSADAVMDLSTGGKLREIRKVIRDACTVSLGSVPLYEAGCMAVQRGKSLLDVTADDMFKAIRLHVEDGVDFVTLHCGFTKQALKYLEDNPRVCGVVSRGGSIMGRWMRRHNQENPLYAHFDEVLDICKERDVTLSLGDALRPGAIADAGDRAQIDELYTLGELARQAHAKGVQVIIEGPGHVPLNQISTQMILEKKACNSAPFYVLGPLVTDIAAGYDHIACAIGGAIAATCGANFLCYVTPAEHLRLPEVEDVKAGVIATRIAAHAADIANNIPGASDRDLAMSKARKARDWETQFALSLDPEGARASREKVRANSDKVCSMCGEFCAMREDAEL